MFYFVIQKFSEHRDLYSKLMDTGDAMLIEANSWKDRFWGEYYHYNFDLKKWDCSGGENKLGKILMNVRLLLGGETIKTL